MALSVQNVKGVMLLFKKYMYYYIYRYCIYFVFFFLNFCTFLCFFFISLGDFGYVTHFTISPVVSDFSPTP